MAIGSARPAAWLGGVLTTLRDPGARGSSHRTEFLAGLTTFVTMAYIVWLHSPPYVGVSGRRNIRP